MGSETRNDEDLFPREIAARLGVSGSAVRSRLSRALTVLRCRLDAGWEGRERWAGVLVAMMRPPESPRVGVTEGMPGSSRGLPRIAVGGVAGAIVLTGVALVVSLSPGDTASFQPAREPGASLAQAGAIVPGNPAGGAVQATDPVLRITGSCVDAEGTPISGARVELPFVASSPETYSQDDGSFELVMPLPLVPDPLMDEAIGWRRASGDRLMIRASALGHANRLVERPLELEGSGGGKIALGVLALPPGGAVEGWVVDPEGAPVSGAWVFVRNPVPEDQEGLLRVFRAHGSRLGPPMLPAQTDGAGYYRLDGVPVLPVSMMARAPGTLFGYTAPVTIRPAEVIRAGNLVLQVAPDDYRIRGIVLGPDGEPFPGCQVDLTDAEGQVGYDRIVNRPDGRFEFLAVPGNGYRVQARIRQGAVLLEGKVLAKAGQTVILPLTELPTSGSPETAGTQRRAEGAATVRDAIDRQETGPLLRVRLSFDGKAAVGWDAGLSFPGGSSSARLDGKGSADLRSEKAGEARLSLMSLGFPSSRWILAPLDLIAGETDWIRDLDTGTLVLRNTGLEEWDGAAEPKGGLLIERPGERDGIWYRHTILYGSPDRIRVPKVPFGRIRILRFEDERILDRPTDRLPALAEIDLEPGEEKTVDLQ